MQWAEQLRCLLRTLSDADVPVALWKGVSHAGTIYADPALRPLGDIDLLVPPARFDQALSCLSSDGYQAQTRRRAGKPRGFHHAVEVEHSAQPFAVDLHVAFSGARRHRLDLNAVWQRAVPAPDWPGAVRLDPVDDLLTHYLHMARSGFIVPVVSYVDAFRLEARLDHAAWRVFERRARAYRILRSTRAARHLAHAFLQDRAPGVPFVPRPRRVLQGHPVSLWRLHLQQLALCDGWQYAWGYVQTHLSALASPANLARWGRRCWRRVYDGASRSC